MEMSAKESCCPGCRAREKVIADLEAMVLKLSDELAGTRAELDKEIDRPRDLEERRKMNAASSDRPPASHPSRSAPDDPEKPRRRKPGKQP